MAATDAVTPEVLDPTCSAPPPSSCSTATSQCRRSTRCSPSASGRPRPGQRGQGSAVSPLLSGTRPVFAITPNEDELAALGSAEALHARGVEVVWVRRGAAGSLLSTPRAWSTSPRRPRYPGRRDRGGRRDARGVLPRAARRRRWPRRRRTGMRRPRSPWPARTPCAPTCRRRGWRRDCIPRSADRRGRRGARGRAPVVALESTIISHGMPYPQNVAMATEVEGIVRAHGAVPATIAVLGGGRGSACRPTTSSCSPATRRWSRSASATCPRSSRAAATARPRSPRRCGWPRWPGIRVFVTGGLGGVHRGAAAVFDVSADLTELARRRWRRLRGREEHPRHRPHPRDARDARRAGAGRRQRRVPVVLLAQQRLPGAAARRRSGRDRRRDGRRVVARPDLRARRRAPDPGGRRDPGRRDRTR